MSVDANYFLTAMPWAGIEDAIIDDQYMVKIPKFYIRCFTPSSGPYKGKKCWEISDSAASGFHVHPAFMRAGRELPCFYIGKYAACRLTAAGRPGSQPNQMPWVDITNPSAIATCNIYYTITGWHLQTIYERAAIALLALVELGTPDVQTVIGSGNVTAGFGNPHGDPVVPSGTTTARYRGIYELWGNLWEHVDGLKGNGTTAQIFDNQGNYTYVNTGVSPAGSGWIKEVYDTSGEKFNLADIFLPKTVDANENNGTFSDCNYFPTSNFITFIGGAVGHNVRPCGMFNVSFSSNASNQYIYGGFRLAKW